MKKSNGIKSKKFYTNKSKFIHKKHNFKKNIIINKIYHRLINTLFESQIKYWKILLINNKYIYLNINKRTTTIQIFSIVIILNKFQENIF